MQGTLHSGRSGCAQVMRCEKLQTAFISVQEGKCANLVQSLRDTAAEILAVAALSFAFLLHEHAVICFGCLSLSLSCESYNKSWYL